MKRAFGKVFNVAAAFVLVVVVWRHIRRSRQRAAQM
jgi:hypothetical protein